MESLIEKFLGSGSGSGYGDGYGSGYGYGYGDGYGYGYGSGSSSGSGYGDGSGSGYGYGYGDGYGYGSGDGDGDGDGYGIKAINEQAVNNIDGVQTIITHVIGDVASGYILQGDLTLTRCYVVKHDQYFAHGATVAEANQALQEKIFENMDTDEVIAAFIDTFQSEGKYPAKMFYDWHHRLTGSCDMGRKAFVKDHGIDVDNDTLTVNEFINLTEGAYGAEIIKQLKQAREEKQ